MVSIVESAILGVVEGLTEFLPISSTGHLILVGQLWLHQTGDKANAFEVFIQLGAIMAIVVLYYRRFLALFQFQPSADPAKPGFTGASAWILLAITTIPASILGLGLHKIINNVLFGPIPVIIALAVGGVILCVIEPIGKRLHAAMPPITDMDSLQNKHALWVGIAQCAALWPGISRSGSTIVGGILSGLDRKTAAEYSFIAAVPIMVLATGYELVKFRHLLTHDDLVPFAMGFVVSFIAAILAVKTFIRFVQVTPLWYFGAYRLVLAALFWVTLH